MHRQTLISYPTVVWRCARGARWIKLHRCIVMAARLTAIRTAITITCMDQLDLWSHVSNSPDSPKVQRARTTTPALESTRSSTAGLLVVLDPELARELHQDPELMRLQTRAQEFAQQARAGATRKAYSNDWRLFDAWCTQYGEQPLPASTATLALYLTQLAELGRKYSSIRRARTAIGQVHAAAGLPRPDRDPRIRVLERGIGRSIGTREQGARPLCVAELERAVNALRDSARDVRDRALLLLGFAGGYRASDLAILDREHISIEGSVLKVFLRRSKEDQLGKGRTTKFRGRANPALCPLRALEQWLTLSPDPTGPLFRVVQGARIEHERIHPRAVSRAVQRAAKRAKLVGEYSAHSLRSGFATSASAHGHTLRAIQEHVGWRDDRTPNRYIDGVLGGAGDVLAGVL
jgi:site-specific recombinase XerD